MKWQAQNNSKETKQKDKHQRASTVFMLTKEPYENIDHLSQFTVTHYNQPQRLIIQPHFLHQQMNRSSNHEKVRKLLLNHLTPEQLKPSTQRHAKLSELYAKKPLSPFKLQLSFNPIILSSFN